MTAVSWSGFRAGPYNTPSTALRLRFKVTAIDFLRFGVNTVNNGCDYFRDFLMVIFMAACYAVAWRGLVLCFGMVDIFISGPTGRIEARYLPPKTASFPVVIILHPHPLQGGRMDNAVVQTMGKAFHQHGLGTLRFNFRGVGHSEGSYGGGDGELNDAAAVVDWLQSSQRIAHKLWIAGFSFGAWIAMQLLMRRPEIEWFVIASPPVHAFDFSFLAPCPVSGQVIAGDNDNIVPLSNMDAFINKLNGQKGIHVDYRVIEGADHSFNERLDTLSSVISDHVGQVTGAYYKNPGLADKCV
jgi:alpha/beta superfamily hydrolase